ncbi:MAG: alpha/beta fold hydrolase [Candidatus Jordarchaeum sp.]|uniref:alpha/beta fold hydrolase n=1 Tax=Candidatus Jordarchaeum sp. TaxID=2823881 RepID=UPI00404A9449
MPTLKVNDLEMYYEIHGEENETPLVLIMGLGSDAKPWLLQIPEFSVNYKVIVFDNRDMGRTSKTDINYTIETMAEDTYHLLKKLEVEKAHILGFSMGGMIAQAFALSYPEKVRSLILCSTTPQGPKGLNILRMWNELIETILHIAKYLNIEQLAKYHHIQLPAAFIRQCEAVEKFDVTERLKDIKAPTLVLVGERDIIAPIWHAKGMASKIPNAQLKVLWGYGHPLFLENAWAFNKVVLEFLEKH